jgi:tetratricopeptide (TPR) repeat protein
MSNIEMPSPRALRWRAPAVCLALAAITFAVFGQTLHHEFVNYDDDEYVYQNPAVTRGLTWKGIAWAFTKPHAGNWHPLTWLSHELDCQLYGLNPAGHHLSNVLIHIATVIALFLVLREMTGAFWPSAFVAAVFAIHPLRVESVAWVAERKDVLSGLFFMLTIGAYVRYARRPWSWRRYGLVVVLFAMGLMSKPMLVTLPLVLLLLDYWPLQRKESAKSLALEKLPLLALSAAVCGVTLLAQTEVIQSAGSFSLPLRLGNALVSCMVYLDQMIYPAGLAVMYPYPHNGLPPWKVALAGILLVGLSAVALGLRWKQPWILVGWLWYLALLLPVMGIIQVGDQAHADRYTYLPLIGIYVALTWLAAELRMNHAAFGALMAGVITVLMFCAWKQTTYWKNSETLWSHALDCTTGNYIAHGNLGGILLKQGKVDEAITEFQETVQINPADAEAHYNFANALRKKGRVDDAIIQFQKALQLQPAYASAHNNLGNTFLQTGRLDEAIDQYQQALQLEPANPGVQINLASLLATSPHAARRDGHKAVELAEQANQLTGGENPLVLHTFAVALAEVGRYSEAVATAQHALRVAEAQSNTSLARALQSELELYQAGKPARGPAQTP